MKAIRVSRKQLNIKLAVREVTSGSVRIGLNSPDFFSSSLTTFRVVLNLKFGRQTFSCVHRILRAVDSLSVNKGDLSFCRPYHGSSS